MLANNLAWNEIKKWATWTAKNAQLEAIGTSVLLPILECVFVNLYTSAQPGQATPFIVALIGLGAFHAILVLFLLIRQNTNPVRLAADTLELQEKLESVTRDGEEKVKRLEEEIAEQAKSYEKELARKVDAYRLLRNVLDTFNLQSCQIDPAAPDAFSKGLLPIIQRVACVAGGTLGVDDEQFTIELYYLNFSNSDSGQTWNPISQERMEHPCFAGYIEPGLFYSSSGLNPSQLNLMGSGSAFCWGWSRGQPGVCYVEDDKHLFCPYGQPQPDSYFRRIATVPVNLVCSSDCIGILALTSMQEKPFYPDILETMRFLASVISQYIASHARCVDEWRAKQKKEEEKRKREERKATKDGGKNGAEEANAEEEIKG